MRNDFAGVFMNPDPAAALRSLGVVPTWHDGEVALGGAPVWTDAAGAVVVSGELVLDNADALRKDLGKAGAAPGELFAELYLRYGASAGEHALGMYALAIWDTRKRKLTLMRDGIGARTLYYAGKGREVWFAARLRTLRRSPAVSDEISLTALRNYLVYAYVPGAETMWSDARELRPGTALTLPEGEIRTYWEPTEVAWDPEDSMENHAGRLRALLEEVVRVRLPTSGPVGVYLSGGVDSSLVTALAIRHAPGPVHTYAIHFGAGLPNELYFSGLVAEHCGTSHHVLVLPAQLIQDKLMETMVALDDPIGDPLTVPNLLLGEAAARDVEVVLNGEGGDPCFGGPKNSPMLLHEIYAPAVSRETAYLRSYAKCYDDLPRLLSPWLQVELRNAQPPEALVAPYLSESPMRSYLNRLLDLNVRLKGADHILTKVNNLTTANGLLGRSPLSDRRIVEMSFAIPPTLKLVGAEEKAVLKRAVVDLLPEAIITRPKSGMMVPVQRWFKNEMKKLAQDMLLDKRSRLKAYVRQDVVREWLDYRGNLWPRHGVKLWLLLTLEMWLRAQGER